MSNEGMLDYESYVPGLNPHHFFSAHQNHFQRKLSKINFGQVGLTHLSPQGKKILRQKQKSKEQHGIGMEKGSWRRDARTQQTQREYQSGFPFLSFAAMLHASPCIFHAKTVFE